MTVDWGPGGPAAPTTVSSDLQSCLRARPVSLLRILFSNHSWWGFFNQFGEFSSLAKFVGGSQEDASPFGSAARYIRAYVPHSFIIVEGLGRVGIQNTHPPSANIFFAVWKEQTNRTEYTYVCQISTEKQTTNSRIFRSPILAHLAYSWHTLGSLWAHPWLTLGSLGSHGSLGSNGSLGSFLAYSWLT